MGEKSEQKKQFIVETARKVFAEKGFKDVTMKDIVEACEISRGGLYLYFENTRGLFLEVMRAEEEKDSSQIIPKQATATDVLMYFLKEQKKEILRKRNSLSIAVYEFYFSERLPRKDNRARKQFEAGSEALEELLLTGVKNGEFSCQDPEGMARCMMYTLEGMKICANTMGITEAMVDNGLLYFMQELSIE